MVAAQTIRASQNVVIGALRGGAAAKAAPAAAAAPSLRANHAALSPARAVAVRAGRRALAVSAAAAGNGAGRGGLAIDLRGAPHAAVA
jgi:hypothetical protein